MAGPRLRGRSEIRVLRRTEGDVYLPVWTMRTEVYDAKRAVGNPRRSARFGARHLASVAGVARLRHSSPPHPAPRLPAQFGARQRRWQGGRGGGKNTCEACGARAGAPCVFLRARLGVRPVELHLRELELYAGAQGNFENYALPLSLFSSSPPHLRPLPCGTLNWVHNGQC